MSIDKPVAAALRENEFLRDIAQRAIRLRAMGRALDQLGADLDDLWKSNPVMSKSGTNQLMMQQAYATELAALDEAIAKAAAAGMDWTNDNPSPQIRPT